MRPERRTVVIERNLPLELSDGTTLYADVWRPEDGGRSPVLLQRTAYDKSSSHSTMHLFGLEPVRAAEHGYVVAIQDVRGRGVSDGRFEPFINERDDGAETVRWAAKLPWSDGRVGMYGASYVGATQLLAADLRPRGLISVAPHTTSADYYNGWTYQAGAFQLGFALLWAAGSLATVELHRRRIRGEDVDELGDQLDALLRDPMRAYRHLPLVDQPVLAELAPAYLEWLAHPTRDEFWRGVSAAERVDAMQVAALHIAGWHDIFLGSTLRSYRAVNRAVKREEVRKQQRLIVGPWAHAVPYDTVGEVEYGPSAGQPALDMTRVHLEWFDSTMGRVHEPAHQAPVRLFIMGSNRWRDEDSWPPPRSRQLVLHLRRDGRLTRELPQAGERPDTFLYDPHDPVPTLGGQTYLPGTFISMNAGQADQRALDVRADVLTYTGDPLDREIEITGYLTVTLYAATTATDTDWTAKLIDLDPRGPALSIADGIIRARHRQSVERGDLLQPGEIYRYSIDLVATSIVIPAGHQLRLQISSSNFPRFDRNPNHGGNIPTATERDFITTRQTVFHDPARPSRLQFGAMV